jgi:hypothetical protein
MRETIILGILGQRRKFDVNISQVFVIRVKFCSPYLNFPHKTS